MECQGHIYYKRLAYSVYKMLPNTMLEVASPPYGSRHVGSVTIRKRV